ncbi:MAG: DUF5689 domain-containing protein [Flavobacteriales bacterium]
MKQIVILLLAVIAFTSCKKEFDAPPSREIPTGSILTIADLRAMYAGSPIHFQSDQTVFAVVTADEVSGNLYKNVYIQDNTGAINIRLRSSGGLYVGDSIRLNLTGTVLSSYNGMMQIDSVDADNNIVKQATGRFIQPEVVTLNMINASYQAKLVRINNVQFVSSDTALTFANAVAQTSQNRTIADCNGNTLLVRTSGYANFAGSNIPNGNGSIVVIVGQFNSDMQLYIRNLSDLTMDGGTRCVEPYLEKDFDDLSISSGGWTQQLVSGGISWSASSFGPDIFGRISNYNGSNNVACESWLISPAVNLSSATNPVLTFRTACNYSGSNIQVYVLTNYDGISNPSTATQTLLSPALSGGSWAWVNSGALNLSSFLTSGVYIGFKYTGTNSDGKTWEVDDILIEEL